MKASEEVYLSSSEFLNVISVDGRRGNLALTTHVTVNTKDNSMKLSYSVRSWSDHASHKFITKQFNDYMEAYNYYQEICNKYQD